MCKPSPGVRQKQGASSPQPESQTSSHQAQTLQRPTWVINCAGEVAWRTGGGQEEGQGQCVSSRGQEVKCRALPPGPFIIPLTQTDYTAHAASPSPQTAPFLSSTSSPHLLSIIPHLIFFCSFFFPPMPSLPLLVSFFFPSFASCFVAVLASCNQVDLHLCSNVWVSFISYCFFFFCCCFFLFTHLQILLALTFPFLSLGIMQEVHLIPQHSLSLLRHQIWHFFLLGWIVFVVFFLFFVHFLIHYYFSHFYTEPVPDLRAHKSCTRTWRGRQDFLSVLVSLLSFPSCPWISLVLLAHVGFIDFGPKFPFIPFSSSF